MTMSITATYAASLALMMIVLRTQVSILRGRTGISILHGDNMALAETMRRHGNFIENVPMNLILMGLAEGLMAPHWLVHSMGASLVAGRIIHVFGIDHRKPATAPRNIGGILTTVSMLAAVVFIFASRFLP